jgi:hypothetical protein
MVCCLFLFLVNFVLKLDFIWIAYVPYLGYVYKSKTNERRISTGLWPFKKKSLRLFEISRTINNPVTQHHNQEHYHRENLKCVCEKPMTL